MPSKGARDDATNKECSLTHCYYPGAGSLQPSREGAVQIHDRDKGVMKHLLQRTSSRSRSCALCVAWNWPLKSGLALKIDPEESKS
jgi:hypothetical protein